MRLSGAFLFLPTNLPTISVGNGLIVRVCFFGSGGAIDEAWLIDAFFVGHLAAAC